MDNDKYIGRLLDDRYEILEVIGTGGMAVVYKARCHRLNRFVAIKILKDDLSQDEEFRRRFHAESQAVAMLSHPNIMAVYDVSTSDEADYIVMELIDGITLKQYMEKKGTLNWKETLHFGMQIAKALEHAHSRGIVHRDIKPHNVMVLKNGSVKVTDFGIARIMSKSNTLTKEALGSVHYISPEQAKGGRVDIRSDLYSLGVVMYEMMTGRAPYDGESPVAVAIQHINGGAPMPSTLNPNIPGGLEQIIMKAMALNPDERYSNATEMLADMEEFRKNPSILFDFNDKAEVDAATMLNSIAQPQERMIPPQPKTTAERIAGVHPDRPAQPKTTSSQGQRNYVESDGMRSSRETDPRRVNRETDPRRVNREMDPRRVNRETDPRRVNRETDPRRTNREADARRSQSRSYSQDREDERQSWNRPVTIAVAVCSAIAVVAILIFLVLLLNGGLFGSDTQMVPVPKLVGKIYDDLDRTLYPDIEIVQGDRVFSDSYEEGVIVDQKPKAQEQLPMGGKVVVYVSMGPEQDELPAIAKLQGMTQDAAQNYLDALKGDLVAKYEQVFDDNVKEGLVVKTEPAEGAQLERGQTVTIYLSKGPEVKKNNVPNIIGKNVETAIEILEKNGFENYRVETEESLSPKDTVTRLSVNVNENMDVTTDIVIYVSEGTVRKSVPNVTDKTYDVATMELNGMGFSKVRTEREENDAPKDTVFRQSISAGVEVDITTEIVLYVSDGPKETTAPPTEAPTTAPTQPQRTIEVSLDLPMDRLKEYQLTIIYEGETVVNNQPIKPFTREFEFQLTGSGVGSYKAYIDGVQYVEKLVDFDD